MSVNQAITKDQADKLISEKKAVRMNSPEYHELVITQWRKVAEHFVYISNYGGWVSREGGIEKGLLKDDQVQHIIGAHLADDSYVLSYGRKDGRVSVSTFVPQARILGESKGCNPDGLSGRFTFQPPEVREALREVHRALVHQDADTHPNGPEVVQVGMHTTYNLWTKPAVKACEPEEYREPRWFLDVVDRFFGCEQFPPLNGSERDWFLDWCAHLVCRPEVKMPVSCLLTSQLNGAGKDFMALALKFMVGEHNYKPLPAEVLKSGFQSFVQGTTLAVVSELYEAGNYGFADRLKSWQSEGELIANIKYGPQTKVRNCVHFLAFSNREAPLNLEDGDRRWFVFNSPQLEAASEAWWDDKWQYVQNREDRNQPHMGEMSNLRRYFEMRLEEIDRDNRRLKAQGRDPRFSIDRPPVTEAKAEIVELSRSGFYRQIKGLMLAEGLRADVKDGSVTLDGLAGQVSEIDKGFRRPPVQQMAEDLKKLGFVRRHTKQGSRWFPPDGCALAVALDI